MCNPFLLLYGNLKSSFESKFAISWVVDVVIKWIEDFLAKKDLHQKQKIVLEIFAGTVWTADFSQLLAATSVALIALKHLRRRDLKTCHLPWQTCLPSHRLGDPCPMPLKTSITLFFPSHCSLLPAPGWEVLQDPRRMPCNLNWLMMSGYC